MITTEEIRGQWTTVRGKLKEKWGQLTEDDLRIGQGDIDQVVGRIQKRVGAEREAVEDFIHHALEDSAEVTSVAVEVAQHAAERVRESYQQVRERAQGYFEDSEEYIRTRPLHTLATTFGAGLVLGALVGFALHSRSSCSDS